MKNWEKIKQNPKFRENFKIRMLVVKAIREFFWERGFLEVETPLLVSSLILESSIDHFNTDLINFNGQKRKMFLTSSPEASLKKLLRGGLGNCFEITKSFRNMEVGIKNHNSEFTILEWYRVNSDYTDLMKETEDLILDIYKKINLNRFRVPCTSRCRVNKPGMTIENKSDLTRIIKYNNKIINLSKPWIRLSVREAMEKYAGIGDEIYNDYQNLSLIKKIALKKGYKVSSENTWEEIFNQIFLNEVEPKIPFLEKPVFLYDYPTPLSALSRIKKSDSRFAERFELYLGGLELADCYSELIDYKEQKQRMKEEEKIIKNKNNEDYIGDEDFLKALKKGMPECSGIAMGIDRLVMLFADVKNIEDVILFPNSQM